MTGLTTLRAMKKVAAQGVFAAALAGLLGFTATGLAAQEQQLWSIVVHFRYASGFEFDYVLERGVATEDVPAALAECARSHWIRSIVPYHCYPVQE